MILYKIICIYFELKSIKNKILSHADVVADMARAKRESRHVATYERATWHTLYKCTSVCPRMCVQV